jgi:hypothetical protein
MPDHRSSDHGVAEVITDIADVRRRFFQIQEAARHEVLSMVTPHLTIVPHGENTAEIAGMKRAYAIAPCRTADADRSQYPGGRARLAGAWQEIRVAFAAPLFSPYYGRRFAVVGSGVPQRVAGGALLTMSSNYLNRSSTESSCGYGEEGMKTILWIILAIIWLALAFWPARVAGRKGHSFIGFFILSLFFWPLSLLLAYLVRDRRAVPVAR